MTVATKRDFSISYGLQTDNTGTSTGNTLFVDQVNDKVGIGQGSPAYTLDVSGDLNFTGTLYQNGSQYYASRWTLTGSDIYRLSKVGINESNPQSQLAVNGYITESTDSGTTYWNVVTQQDIGTDANQVPLNQYLGKLAFLDDFSPNGLRREGGSSDDVVVDSSGNVGIGVAPSYRLHTSIYGSNYLYLDNTRGPASAHIGVLDNETQFVVGGAHPLTFGTNSTERMRIDSLGRVGIGTGSLALGNYQFNQLVVAATGVDTGFTIASDTDRSGVIAFADGTASSAQKYRGRIEYDHADDSLGINTSAARALTIDSSQRVGIGTTSPNSILHCSSSNDTAITIADTSVDDTHEQVVLMNNSGNFNIRTHQSNGTFKSIDYIINKGASGAVDHEWRIENSEKMKLDSAGRLLVGTSSARDDFNNGATSCKVQIEGTNFASSSLSVTRNSVDQGSPTLELAKTRSGSNGGVIAVENSDKLGTINFAGADGTDIVRGARIEAAVDGTPGANNMPGRLMFSTSASGASSPTEQMRIDSSGRLLLGTTTEGNSSFDNLTIADTGHCGVTIRSGTSSEGNIAFSDGTSGVDEYRGLIRYNHSDNNLVVLVNALERLRIDSSGNVGINDTNPDQKLVVAGNIRTTGSLYGPANFIIDPAAVGDDTGTVEIKGNLVVQGTTTTINSTTVDLDHLSLGDNEIANFGNSNDLQIYHNGSNSYIDDAGTGNLIIGAANFQLMNVAHTENHITASDNGSVAIYYDAVQKFQTTLGGVRIGSATAPIDINAYETLNNGTLSFEGSAGQLFSITNNLTSGSIFSVNDVSGIPSIDVDADGTITLAEFGGNVGIGNTNPQYTLEVTGSFAATTKSFVIDHPTKEGMKLRYGSLEGPENGVYVRGKTTEFAIELPDYWTGLVDEDTITVNLTPFGKTQTLWVKEIKDNKVFVGSKCATVEYFYTVFGERKDVEKLEVEF